jgi:three-Cys-motif partner protein
VTQQEMFGGPWTQQKLEVLSAYLRAYRKIFTKNQRARFFKTSYIDAFAGTGIIPRPKLGGLIESLPELAATEEEFRKGSVRRALEITSPFDHYILIEKDRKKCAELDLIAKEFPGRDIKILNEDANVALLKWCKNINTKRERAVIFLDPFATSVEWQVIEAIANTKAADLWILFPYAAINRMLVNDKMPPEKWADRLTKIFGTAEWKKKFYASESWQSLITPNEQVERVYKTADQAQITEFFVNRLKQKFPEVANPGFLYNSRSLLFVLLFASGNVQGSKTGVKIANHLLRDMSG